MNEKPCDVGHPGAASPGCVWVDGMRELLQFKGWHIQLRVEQLPTGEVAGEAVFTRSDGEVQRAPVRGADHLWWEVVRALLGAQRCTSGIDRSKPL